MTLANNLIGLAPGPLIVGMLSDVLGLKLALTLAPVLALAAAAFFVLASRSHEADAASNHARCAQAARLNAARTNVRRSSPRRISQHEHGLDMSGWREPLRPPRTVIATKGFE
jgi:hypothetical protein